MKKISYSASLIIFILTTSWSYSQNSVDEVVANSYGDHEGRPHGVGSGVQWYSGPVIDNPGGRSPQGWDALNGWGQVYEDISETPTTNTRVEIDNMLTYYLSRADNEWHLLTDDNIQGAYYAEDFADNASIPGIQRTEANGNISVMPGVGQHQGHNFHFWNRRSYISTGDIKGLYITCRARLILDDPEGPDDRDQARYIMSVGGDYWYSISAPWDEFYTNGGVGVGRFIYLNSSWRTATICTLSEQQIRSNPPPPFSSYRTDKFWHESFTSLSPGTTADQGDTKWSSSEATLQVSEEWKRDKLYNHRLQLSGNGNERVWTSEKIQTGNAVVRVSLDVDDETNNKKESEDYINAFYRVDGGEETAFGSVNGNIGFTNLSTSGITVNNNIQLVIKAKTSTADEEYFIDNIDLRWSSTEPDRGENLIVNPSFEMPGLESQSIDGWFTWSGTSSEDADFIESYGSQTDGNWHLTHYRGETGSWNCYTSQTITGLVNGSYTLKVNARKVGEGFLGSGISAKNNGSEDRFVNVPSSDFMQPLKITGIQVTNGQCEIGVWTEVQNGSNWPYVHVDEFDFFLDEITIEDSGADTWYVLNNSQVELRPNTWRGDWTRWSFEPVGGPQAKIERGNSNKVAQAKATIAGAAIQVYPNPSNGVLTISLADDSHIKITDLHGRRIYEDDLTSGDHQIDLSRYGAGVYLLKTGEAQLVKLMLK